MLASRIFPISPSSRSSSCAWRSISIPRWSYCVKVCFFACFIFKKGSFRFQCFFACCLLTAFPSKGILFLSSVDVFDRVTLLLLFNLRITHKSSCNLIYDTTASTSFRKSCPAYCLYRWIASLNRAVFRPAAVSIASSSLLSSIGRDYMAHSHKVF